jgi:hypothetical protein
MLPPNILKSIALTVLTLGSGNVMLYGQAPDTTGGKKIFGYQDAQTGAFHPLAFDMPVENATTPTTGTLKVVITITVKSTWPTGTVRTIVCSSAFAVSAATPTGVAASYSEDAFVYATGSGTAFTCTLTIPYSWVIPTTAISKTLTGDYSVGVQNTATAAGPPVLRVTSGLIVSTTTLPATGTTTTYSIAATI